MEEATSSFQGMVKNHISLKTVCFVISNNLLVAVIV